MARRVRVPAMPSNLGAARRVEIKGLREYCLKLAELGDGMISKGCVVALAPGADLLRNAARNRAPVLQAPDPRRKPGTLRDAIQAIRVKATAFAATYVVGVKMLSGQAVGAFKRKTGRMATENPDDPFYGPILEFGRTARTRRRFLLPAFQASGEDAVKLAGQKLAQYTDAEIRRLGARK